MLSETRLPTGLSVTEKLLTQCCSERLTGLLMLPGSRSMIQVQFNELSWPEVLFDITEKEHGLIPAKDLAYVHFYFDLSNRMLQCRVVQSDFRNGRSTVQLAIVSDCIARERRIAFRIPIKEPRGLGFTVTHPKTGSHNARLVDLSKTGCKAEVIRSATGQWEIGDTVSSQLDLNGIRCELDARVVRVGLSVGLEFLDPETHTVPESRELDQIAAELERNYLRNRIQIRN